jgi:hypothetical protein
MSMSALTLTPHPGLCEIWRFDWCKRYHPHSLPTSQTSVRPVNARYTPVPDIKPPERLQHLRRSPLAVHSTSSYWRALSRWCLRVLHPYTYLHMAQPLTPALVTYNPGITLSSHIYQGIGRHPGAGRHGLQDCNTKTCRP